MAQAPTTLVAGGIGLRDCVSTQIGVPFSGFRRADPQRPWVTATPSRRESRTADLEPADVRTYESPAAGGSRATGLSAACACTACSESYARA